MRHRVAQSAVFGRASAPPGEPALKFQALGRSASHRDSAILGKRPAASQAAPDDTRISRCPRRSPAVIMPRCTGRRRATGCRLADTELWIEVERDLTTYGEEVKFGGGKVIRDGMGQSQATREEGAVDTVITNALILDWSGIYKADIGLRDGRDRADRQGRAIPTPSRASTSSSAPAPRRSRPRGGSSLRAASTATSISSARSRSTMRFTPA